MKTVHFAASLPLSPRAVAFACFLVIALGGVATQALQTGDFEGDGRGICDPDLQEWAGVPNGRFPYVVAVADTSGKIHGQGVVVGRFRVLTGHHTIEQAGGLRAVVINVTQAAGNDNGPEIVKQRHVLEVAVHPNETEGQYGVALLKVKEPFEKGPIPALADPTRIPVVNEEMQGFSVGSHSNVELQSAQFLVANASVWPQLQGYYVTSKFAEVHIDVVGWALVELDYPPNWRTYKDRVQYGRPDMDVLAAIVTIANDTWLKGNGTYLVGFQRLGPLSGWITCKTMEDRPQNVTQTLQTALGDSHSWWTWTATMLICIGATIASVVTCGVWCQRDAAEMLLAGAFCLRSQRILNFVLSRSSKYRKIRAPNDGGEEIVCIYFDRSVGYGGQGRIFEGEIWHIFSQRPKVAVKVSYEISGRKNKEGTRVQAGALQREYKLLKITKEHSNVLRCYGFGYLKDGSEFVATELMQMDLERLIKDQGAPSGMPALTYWDVLKIFRDIAKGMQHLFNLAIAHFDLKPGNVLVNIIVAMRICTVKIVKVGDFGISEMLTRTMGTGKFKGTLWFMASELKRARKAQQKKGRKVIVNRKKVDIYSFGRSLRSCTMEASSEKCGIQDVDDLIGECESENPADRPSWDDVLAKLSHLIKTKPPWAMQKIPPGHLMMKFESKGSPGSSSTIA